MKANIGKYLKRQQQYRVVRFRIGWVGSIGAFLSRASRAVHGSLHGCMVWCLVLGGLPYLFGVPEPVTSLMGGCICYSV